MGINTLSITDAEALLEIIPPEDNAFGQIRGLFGLYIDGTEGINEKFVLDSDVFKGFFAVFSEQVYQVLIGNATRIKEKKEITMLHDGHLLEMRIQKLKKKSILSGKLEYCPIKLDAASGMTELPQKMSLSNIKSFLQMIYTDDNSIVEQRMSLIKSTFQENGLYDDETAYHVQLVLSSKDYLGISINHESKRTKESSSGNTFFLAKDHKTILNILYEQGTYENSIEDVFGLLPEDDDDGEALA